MPDIKELTAEKFTAELDKIAKAYKAAITDEAAHKKHTNFQAFLKNKKVVSPAKEQKRIAIIIHESIRRQLSEHSLLQFLIMEKKNDFGQMGEQRVSISFCRNILGIPANKEVTQDDADIFREKIDEFEKKIGISKLSKLAEKELIFSLDILGEKFKLTDNEEFNELMMYLGIPYGLFVGNIKGITTFIYGKLEPKVIAGKEIIIIGKEIVRAPHYVLSIAAGQGSVGVFIRRESCETIFYNKWVSFFSLSKAERQIYAAHPYSGIREGIKEVALKYYKVNSKAEIEKIKDTFINEMIEGIFYHELGHEVGELDNIPLEENLIAKSRGIVGDDIVVVLKEAIADWAPPVNKQSGPIWAFLQKGKKDPDKAMRLFYVYLSDNWFIDSDDEFMGIQTDILCGLLLSFIQKNGEVDLERLQKEFKGVFKFILNNYVTLLSKIKKLLREGSYMAGIHRLNFESLEKELYKVFAKKVPDVNVEELRKKTSFWVQLMGLVKSFSPETHNKIEKLILDSATEVKKTILDKITRGDAEKYENSLREYILHKMSEVGVFRKKERPETKLVLDPIYKSLKIPTPLVKKVHNKIESLLNGESIDIAISYEGKPDPFWAVFQEMLLRSGAGNIRSGMALGEEMDLKDTPEQKKEKVRDALESIRDQIESEMYLEVKLLRVDAQYMDKKVFDPILAEVKFYDDTLLQQKIGNVQFIELKAQRILEAYIPIKRGFVDWNTSQAIWRINQELRADDYLKQWTIDKLFMETLMERLITAV